jgi:hypothetical protein
MKATSIGKAIIFKQSPHRIPKSTMPRCRGTHSGLQNRSSASRANSLQLVRGFCEDCRFTNRSGLPRQQHPGLVTSNAGVLARPGNPRGGPFFGAGLPSTRAAHRPQGTGIHPPRNSCQRLQPGLRRCSIGSHLCRSNTRGWLRRIQKAHRRSRAPAV